MFLKELSLKHFKCVEDLTVSFEGEVSNRKWTFFLGENGTGKSNILKSIALVTAGSNALGELLGNTDEWIKTDQINCRIAAKLETQKGEIRNISLVINRGDNLSQIVSNNKDSLSLIDHALENADRNYFVVAYGATRRLTNDSFSQYSRTRYGGRALKVRNLFDGTFALNPLASWIIDLDYRAGKEGLNIIKQALNDFLPGTEFHSIDKDKKQVLFKTNDGIFPLEQLSDGFQNMASWIGDLLFRITETFRDYDNPLQARGLLLIDEIDLHLHPKWQRKLYDFISSKLPHFQVVTTTHSPLTVQQAGEGELFILRRDENDSVEFIPFRGAPKNLLINQLLMTPAFGLETDESLEVEKTKNQYDELKAKGENLSETERRSLKEIEGKLIHYLPKRTMLRMNEAERELFEKIERHLNKK